MIGVSSKSTSRAIIYRIRYSSTNDIRQLGDLETIVATFFRMPAPLRVGMEVMKAGRQAGVTSGEVGFVYGHVKLDEFSGVTLNIRLQLPTYMPFRGAAIRAGR
jgi:hypothetical protein